MTVVKISALELPQDRAPELERRFAAQRNAMADVPGSLGFELLRPVAGEDRYFVVSRWESDAAFRAWREGEHREGVHSEERGKPVSTHSATLEFEVVDLDAVAAGS